MFAGKYRKWLNKNWILLVPVFTLIITTVLYIREWRTWEETFEIFLLNAVLIFVVCIGWILDHVYRARSINARSMSLDLLSNLRGIEVPFLLRVSAGPDPLARFSDRNRIPEIVKQKSFWDWSFYQRSSFSETNTKIISEVKDMYFSHEIDTSSVGIIDDTHRFDDSFIFVGIVHSEESQIDFIGKPWELRGNGQTNLRPLKAYRYGYGPPKSSGTELTRCVVYEQTDAIQKLWQNVMDKLFNCDPEMSIFSEKTDWTEEVTRTSLPKFEDHFSSTSSIKLRELGFRSLLQISSGQDKIAIFVLVLGYLLSPLSPGNDVLINILPSYALALLIEPLIPLSIVVITLIIYLLSNVLGIAMIAIAARFLTKHFELKPSLRQILILTFYSLAIIGFFIGIDMINIEFQFLEVPEGIKKFLWQRQ